MKKIFLVILLASIVVSCTLSFNESESAFEEKAGTQVAVALTATALDEFFSGGTEIEPSETDQPEPVATETKEVKSDAQLNLGSPTYTDTCSTLSAWSADPVDEIVVEGVTTMKIDEGRLSAQSSQTGKFHWRLNYQEFKDGYLEAVFETGNCSGNDEYGLIFRAPDYSDGVGFYFSLTCDGHFGLRQKTEAYTFMQESEMIVSMSQSDDINTGPDQTNILGVRAVGDALKLYINDQLVEEISGVSLTAGGHFGLYIYARQTPGFAIYLDEIRFWNLSN